MSKADRYHGRDRETRTRRASQVVADSQSTGLFQTGQGGRPVLPPVSSGFSTSGLPGLLFQTAFIMRLVQFTRSCV